MKKTLRLVLPLIVLVFSTMVCGFFSGPCDELPIADRPACDQRETQRVAEQDAINALTHTAAYLTAGGQPNFALQPPTSTATPIPIIPTNTFTPVPVPQSVLPSGAYQVDVLTGGKEYHSTWTLEVVGEVVTGSSAWDCCPSARTDELSGTFVGEELTLERDCSGQGFEGPCTQTYKGTIKGNTIDGTITGTGIPPSGATWTLYLGP